jgi:hypothetical protein
MLDAALDPIAAAHIHVVVHAYRGTRQFQRQRDLVGKTRHLHGGKNIEDFTPRIPTGQHAECFDRDRRAATPFKLQRQTVRALRKILLDLAPDEGAVEKHVRAVLGVHDRTARRIGLLAVEHERQRLVLDLNQLRRIFRERAAVGDHRGDPFARIAGDVDGERAARHLRRIEAGEEWRGRRRELAAVEHVMHAGKVERRRFVHAQDARRGIRAGHHRDIPHAGQHDVSGEATLAGDETPVLAHAAVARHEPEWLRRAHGLPTGWLSPRMRSAASAIASTIWA